MESEFISLTGEPTAVAANLAVLTGARWTVDGSENFHTDLQCATTGGHITVRLLAPATRFDDTMWAVLTTAGAVKNEWREGFATIEEAARLASRLFTWHPPKEWLSAEGDVWVALGVDVYRLPDWSEVVYFTEGETWGHALPRWGRLGWVVGQWLADHIPHRWKLRNKALGWFLRFRGGYDCSCELGAPCSGLIHTGEACWGGD